MQNKIGPKSKDCVLVVVAHADDEALGCGGTLARHVSEGDIVHLVLMTDGVSARSSASSQDVDRRTDAMRAAQNILGIESIDVLGFPDNQMDSIALLEIVQKLELVIERLRPSVIYTHHHGDLNIDHRLTYEAVMTACRPVPGMSVRKIYGIEILSSTEWGTAQRAPFLPTLFVDITDQLAIKVSALEAYADEMRLPPHSRNILHAEVLARHRGYSVGMEAAEAFTVYRILQ